ncbi:hypothetical protein [Sedimentitalea arenosa]|uniref:Uncharacterized protein n=1 Tax=Sedimentitalea arenosa TaxID=2798803 RepID=A0A8J7J440_9RHOB|nr:hypothetical protein [Arenibacterium arenosum]MBJ6373390.1 hypothetical protein [Arenibacterium arenosum]
MASPIVRRMDRAVYIHAGAHRTGSSSFQLCLSANRARLEAAGFALAYPGRDGVPGGRLRLRLPRPRHGEKRVPAFAAQARAHVAALCPEGEAGLILSEENILGPMRHLYEGRFYPAAGKRCATLRAALGAPAHLLLVVRDYADLVVSAHRKRAEDNPVPPFAELVPAVLGLDRGWPELVAEMRDALAPARLTVVPYARRGESREVLARLVPGLEAAALREPSRAVNLSATDAALLALQARYRQGETLARRDWQRVIAEHAEDRAPRGFAALEAADRARLLARYERDLARLAELPGVTLWGGARLP